MSIINNENSDCSRTPTPTSASDASSPDTKKKDHQEVQRTVLPMVEERAACQALIRALDAAGIKFIRYMGLDVNGTIRSKTVTLEQLKRSKSTKNQAAIARICIAGMPSHADIPLAASGLSSKDSDVIDPDLSTLRILPYTKSSAAVIGNFVSPETGVTSDVCSRGFLQSVVREAKVKYDITFLVGVEIEFVLFDQAKKRPVDQSTFANTVTLNNQDDFISELYRCLEVQDIEIEQIHSESSPGQLEVVLHYGRDPLALADAVVLTRETISSVALQFGLKALFLPKVFPEQAGNGCHIHLSMERGDKRLPIICSVEDRLAGPTASMMEGILRHLGSLMALTVPTCNSHRRVGPGCWTGSSASWGFDDKERGLRLVRKVGTTGWDHVEYKLMDSSANIYAGLGGVLLAGLSGVEKDLSLRPSGAGEELPSTAAECLDYLEKDDLFVERMPAALLRGTVAARRAGVERDEKMALEEVVQDKLGSG